MPGPAVRDSAGSGHDYCQWRGRYQPSSRTEAFGEGKVSYDAETNTLTINGGLTNAGSPTATVIQGNGTTDVKIDGGESPAAFGLTVTGAKNVTVTANSNSPAIYGSSTGVGANITCSGDVEITNESSIAVYNSLTVNGAQNVTVTANGNSPAITNDVIITCSGDVEITNSAGQAVGYTLFVHSAQNVTVTANNFNAYAITNGAEIACSGNVEITSKGNFYSSAVSGTLTVNRAQDVTVTANSGQAVSGTLTVNDAQNVTVTANISEYAAITQNVSITCSGDVEIVNKGGGQAVRYTLTFQQSNGHSYTVKTKTGSSQDALTIYAEKAAGETFGPVSLEETVSAVKIESAGHTPGEWEHNRTQHWQVCTACGAELDRADHTFIGRTCTVCGYTKPSTSGGVSTYAINVESAENGTVTVAPKTAAKGTTVTLTVEPDKGYTLETLTVTDKNGNEIELTNKGDGKYTFTMPASKVTVKATFMEDNSKLNFFVDVPADAYYYDAVLWAVENGVTEGTNADGTLFSPNDPCTRAQVVTFLWRAAGSPEPESLRSLSDVPADAYYAKAVAWALENGITTGTGDGLFSPDAVCSRAQIVTFLWRAQQSPAAGSANPFLDVAADAYYTDAVLWAVENGVTMGTNAEGTAFSPDDDCTRAQIVTFLYRCLGGE